MGKRFTYYIDLSNIQFADGQKTSWLHAMPVGDVAHPIYGDIKFDTESLTGYANSVKTRVLGTVDPAIDYDHMAHSGVAAGWVKDAKTQFGGGDGDGLQLFVEWTDEAVRKIKNKEYRYFSPTFDDEWEDQTGSKHKHVIFGGAITNRPYLKNLVPLNMSDLTFGPVDPAPPVPPKEKEVDLKKLAEILGLAADTPEADIYKAFGERLQAPKPPTDPAPAPPPAPFELTEDMKKLAAGNPQLKHVFETIQHLAAQNVENRNKLLEQGVDSRLSEFDRAHMVLSPVAKDAVKKLALTLSADQQKEFWDILTSMRDNNSFFVELGERGSSHVDPGRGQREASSVLSEKVKALMAQDPKLSQTDALDKVLMAEPSLWAQYRSQSYITQQP